MSLIAFKGMSKADFLGKYIPVHPDKTRVNLVDFKLPTTPVPFLGKYQIRWGVNRANVFDGAKLIAMYHVGNSQALIILDDIKYRKQGIAKNLIKEMCIRTGKPPQSQRRTPYIQKACEWAYDSIQQDLTKI